MKGLSYGYKASLQFSFVEFQYKVLLT